MGVFGIPVPEFFCCTELTEVPGAGIEFVPNHPGVLGRVYGAVPSHLGRVNGPGGRR